MNDSLQEQLQSWQRDYRVKIHDLREQFESRLPVARSVLSRAEAILRHSIAESRIKCEVTSRLKDFDSFRMKFRQKFHAHRRAYIASQEADVTQSDYHASKVGGLLEDPFTQITDVIGIRCVGLFTRELYPFGRGLPSMQNATNANGPSDYFVLREIVANRFDDAGKNGRQPAPSPDEKLSPESGYRSVHYDLRLKADSVVVALERELLELSFELQVRTYSQHMVDDVSHFLSYKSDDLFYSSETFQEETAKLQNDLTMIQAKIDNLFESSKRTFNEILDDVRNGRIERLLKLPITPDTLRLYAIYQFVVLSPPGLPNLPATPEEARFSSLWLRELSEGLNDLGMQTIDEVQKATKRGMPFAVRYASQGTHRRSIFKPADLTDILSKCLLFSERRLRDTYPILKETREQIEALLPKEKGVLT